MNLADGSPVGEELGNFMQSTKLDSIVPWDMIEFLPGDQRTFLPNVGGVGSPWAAIFFVRCPRDYSQPSALSRFGRMRNLVCAPQHFQCWPNDQHTSTQQASFARGTSKRSWKTPSCEAIAYLRKYHHHLEFHELYRIAAAFHYFKP